MQLTNDPPYAQSDVRGDHKPASPGKCAPGQVQECKAGVAITDMLPCAEGIHVSGNQEEKRNGHPTTDDKSKKGILEERNRTMFLYSRRVKPICEARAKVISHDGQGGDASKALKATSACAFCKVFSKTWEDGTHIHPVIGSLVD
jgi:hypothetical protein